MYVDIFHIICECELCKNVAKDIRSVSNRIALTIWIISLDHPLPMFVCFPLFLFIRVCRSVNELGSIRISLNQNPSPVTISKLELGPYSLGILNSILKLDSSGFLSPLDNIRISDS